MTLIKDLGVKAQEAARLETLLLTPNLLEELSLSQFPELRRSRD